MQGKWKRKNCRGGVKFNKDDYYIHKNFEEEKRANKLSEKRQEEEPVKKGVGKKCPKTHD